MITGLSGTLLSHEALELAARGEGQFALGHDNLHFRRNALRAWHLSVTRRLGPASGPRAVFDEVAVPLLSALGYRVIPIAVTDSIVRAVLQAGSRRIAALIVSAWGRDAASTWRDAVKQGIGFDVRWCLCFNGPAVRVVDSRRTYSRRYVEFQLDATIGHERTFNVLWQLLSASAMSASGDGALERAISATEQHRGEVRKSLQQGVERALTHLLHAFQRAARPHRTALPLSSTFTESLIVIYRLLFLLFAEARGLVPRWHPIYRDGYTIESLRTPVEMLPRPPGLWHALQAIARLAHRGCRVGALEVPAFNGRLFSPVHSPLADTLNLDDGEVRRGVLELMTREGGRERGRKPGRVRVAYGDLGVEQLGAIYERLLDIEPSPAARGAPALVRAETRKATGSFYTPRSLTEFVVRRTLAPLVADASPEQILAVRVLDPAMGSGAFLVAACRYLAAAYEAALVREGALVTGDIDEAERAGFRRAIAQQCLFGVDLNPMAVQLGRLSIWLATLAANRPLTFLDHRLRCGNSLVGAGLADVMRQAPGRSRRSRSVLPLFPDEEVQHALGHAVGVRAAIAAQPDDSLARVRQKERALSELHEGDSVYARWREVADVWCADWFRDADERRVPFGAVADSIVGRAAVLPAAVAEGIRSNVRVIAARERFFHWTLEFPEAFFDGEGQPLARPGFDAILGNPPWEMLRGDRGNTELRRRRRAGGAQLTAFVRSSGTYRHQGDGHTNLYQLFVERTLSLVRDGGRLGLILPAGFAVDHGSAGLRRALLDRTTVDTFVSVENRNGLFPIHRGMKFLMVSATAGSAAAAIHCRFGISSPDALDAIHDLKNPDGGVVLTRELLERVGGASLAVPELPLPIDVEIFTDVAFRWPALGDPDGWSVRFGRELNATDDREHFLPSSATTSGLPVLEGKHLVPFAVHPERSAHRIRRSVAARLLDGPRTFERPRLAYRDVAAATNRLSLIAAVVPAGVVTTHTLSCLKDALDEESQYYLCGMFNSLVANYLVRPRITTHVSAAIIDRLPLPRLPSSSPLFRRIAALAKSMSASPSRGDAAALQALAARAYGVDEHHFRHIVGTFPLLSSEDRDDPVRAFCDMMP